MHLLVNLTAILGLEDIADPLIHVSPRLWYDLNETYPAHCYGDLGVFDSTAYRPTGSGHPDIPYHYRVDIRGLLGLAGPREAVAVSKDQWMAISSRPEWRQFCFGGETRSVLAKKQQLQEKPENYDNWFSDIDFQATVTNEYGQRYVSRKVALDNWKGDGRSAKAFENCEKYAIQKGDIAPGRNDSGLIQILRED